MSALPESVANSIHLKITQGANRFAERQRFKEHLNDDRHSLQRALTKNEDIFDGRAAADDKDDNLNRTFRVELLKELSNLIKNSAAKLSTTKPKPDHKDRQSPPKIVGVMVARTTPPSQKAAIVAKPVFQQRKIIQRQKHKTLNALDAYTIQIDEITDCIKAGEQVFHDKQLTERQVKTLMHHFGRNIDISLREIALLISVNFIEGKITHKDNKETIQKLANDAAYLCFIIILGIEPKNLAYINIKGKIDTEINESGFFNGYHKLKAEEAMVLSLPGMAMNHVDGRAVISNSNLNKDKSQNTLLFHPLHINGNASSNTITMTTASATPYSRTNQAFFSDAATTLVSPGQHTSQEQSRLGMETTISFSKPSGNKANQNSKANVSATNTNANAGNGNGNGNGPMQAKKSGWKLCSCLP